MTSDNGCLSKEAKQPDVTLYDEIVTETEDGERDFDIDLALSVLLRQGVLFSNTRKTSDDEYTIVLYVLCNDIFAWGYADAEPLTTEDVENLYLSWYKDPKWGVGKWCCHRRQEKPQKAVEQDMQAVGSWDSDMESLPCNRTTVGRQPRFSLFRID